MTNENNTPLKIEQPFQPFPKIPRLFRDMVITEKLDGTNAVVYIEGDTNIKAGSRKRWITPEDDNFGFAKWVETNKKSLLTLGNGFHYGEWVGPGIQSNPYNLKEKRFYLFKIPSNGLPDCCYVVPTLYEGPFCTEKIKETLRLLKCHGSFAVEGCMKPEGIVIWHEALRTLSKITCEKDDYAKTEVKPSEK